MSDALKEIREAVSMFMYNKITLGEYEEKLRPWHDAKPIKHGRWVIEPDATVMHCDVCGWLFEYYGGLEEEWNYCPHCGARMSGVTE